MGEQETLDEHWMRRALAQADRAHRNEIIAEGWNQPIAAHDPSAHAEMIAMLAAGQAMQNYRLPDTTLYVTLEPCLMCAGAMIHARVSRVVFGAYDSKRGVVSSQWDVFDAPWLNHHVEVAGGVLEYECADKLKRFFKQKRD